MSVKNFLQMVLVFFFQKVEFEMTPGFKPFTVFFGGTENGNGIELYLYKILVIFSLSLDLRLSTGNPNKWYRRFMSSQ